MPTLDKMELQEQTFLRGKFSHLIHWEKAKKRERVLVAALSYSLLVSLVFLPLQGYLPPRYAFLSFPPLFFILFALGFSVARPWRERESVRTVSFLDKVLHLQERALTAWEILGRKENGPAERMVLEETAEKLRRLEPQTLFRRQLSWHVYLVPPLLLFWTILLWLDVGFRFDWSRTSTVVPLAQKLSEFSQDLEEKSKAGELEESARMAQALEEIAAKGLREEVGLEELRDNLASMVSRVERGTSSLGRDASRSFADFSSGDLSGLMAELNEFQDSLVLPDSTAGKGLSASDLFQQLSTFPLLKEELEKVLSSIQNLNRESIRDFLRRTERGARSELDRRSLQGVREYLLQLLNEINDKEVSGLSQNFALPRPEGSLPDKKGQG
ncbi:MAG: hypothetical protein QF619_00100, partial [Candidatus Binatia bacterium]|nr:hypothetical protein [Candidatus Binatia bacterium]